MRTSILLLAILATIAVATDSAQQGQATSDSDDRTAATRVDTASRRLKYNENDPADRERHYAELDADTEQVRRHVDAFVQSLSVTQDSDRIQRRLRTVLKSHIPEQGYGALPFARVLDMRSGKFLVIAYTLVRPPHHDIATIRGYRVRAGRFELADTTAVDFERYHLLEAELRSPSQDEFSMLAWGQELTGTSVRARVYVFDGQRFKTVWAPEDIPYAKVHASDAGFSIDHDVRRPPYTIHDEYSLTRNGVIKTN